MALLPQPLNNRPQVAGTQLPGQSPFASTPQQMAQLQQNLAGAVPPDRLSIAGQAALGAQQPGGLTNQQAGAALQRGDPAIRSRLGELLREGAASGAVDLGQLTPFPGQVGGEPLTGLAGATDAINRGLGRAQGFIEQGTAESTGAVETGRERGLEALTGQTGLAIEDLLGSSQQAQGTLGTQFGQAQAGLEGFTQGGTGAQQQQAALSGALGPEAQAAAFQAFTESPGQAFLREQSERSLTRNAAALGGLGGGRVREELARFGQGLAQQDFQNQFNRLGTVAERGLGAQRNIADLQSNLGLQQAGLQSGTGQLTSALQAGLGAQQAGIEGGTASQLANILGGRGQTLAGFQGSAAGQLSNLRTQAGRDLASAIGQTTQGVSGLSAEQGEGLSNIFGANAANVANLMNAAGTGDAAAQEELGQLLAGLSQTESANLANLFSGGGQLIAGGQSAGANQLLNSLFGSGKAGTQSPLQQVLDVF